MADDNTADPSVSAHLPTIAENQRQMLQQLVNLVPAVQQLAQRAVAPAPPEPNVTVRKAEFAYRFLGYLLGRSDQVLATSDTGFDIPKVPSVTVKKDTSGIIITFSGLAQGMTRAWLRPRRSKPQFLDLTPSPSPSSPNQATAKVDLSDPYEPLDAIFVLDKDDVPLAMAPCWPPPSSAL